MNIGDLEHFLEIMSVVAETRLVHAALFIVDYLGTLLGNLLSVAITALDWRLHTPVYFFLRHLCVLELCLISVIIPQSIHNSLKQRREISSLGCAFQVFVFILCVQTPLLKTMSFDRYAVICLPWRYRVIMDDGACGKMAAASWLFGSLSAMTHSIATFSVPNLSVVTLLVANGTFAYLKPVSESPSTVDLLVSVCAPVVGAHTVVPPALNPLFYSLRNRDMKAPQRRMIRLLSPRSPKHWFYARLFPITATKPHEETRRRNSASPTLDRPELSVLTGMPYDCYAAICHPLRYHFFCNVPPLPKISCSETHIAVDVSLVMGIGFGFFSFVSIVISYVNIFLAVLSPQITWSKTRQ
ncbi:olfactory receptor 14J1-like [Tachyglossus aculeatus]|uniref:olfactory receptor 14J1-like n=1 Tax=Tachyglossus aculeatus TaxID=9261 RepID=UPI0018F5CA4F|nr:olfactory receptor 14J1-like [Tachyglossus aculeatus]